MYIHVLLQLAHAICLYSEPVAQYIFTFIAQIESVHLFIHFVMYGVNAQQDFCEGNSYTTYVFHHKRSIYATQQQQHSITVNQQKESMHTRVQNEAVLASHIFYVLSFIHSTNYYLQFALFISQLLLSLSYASSVTGGLKHGHFLLIQSRVSVVKSRNTTAFAKPCAELPIPYIERAKFIAHKKIL